MQSRNDLEAVCGDWAGGGTRFPASVHVAC